MNQQKNTRARRRRRKKSPFRRFLRFVLLISLLFVLSAAGYGGYLVYKIKANADKSFVDLKDDKSDLRMDEVQLGKDPVTILLVGIENYQANDVGRADVIKLITINPETKETAMVNIPRDTRTYIPAIEEKDKINHSYAYGKKGMREKAVMEATEELLGVPIDYFVSTNFDGFEDVVDELGGITVNVPFDFKQASFKRMITFKEGPMDLDGEEALAFVRMRKQDPRGDIGRNERESEAIRAIMEKAISVKSFSKVDNVIDELGNNVKTNISTTEMFAMRNFYRTLKNKEFDTLQLKTYPETINGVSYEIPTDESVSEIRAELSKILEIEDELEQTNNGFEQNE
ncbi:LCP family protein [Fictibacillus nanhaiensis]|uniref:LCP family protein n=1 Tax=Fictibacillus nanhaiensis TaxID=742169 RepID=UPI001C98C3F8|nr:LCP family protein [Fictibacillus nanhaiensis]MBY6037075.1 LCP family protein [Fictibacillus nanhaiensis]